MRKQVILAAIAVSTMGISGCATPGPTGYQAAASSRDYGFNETRIEADRYRITYRGSARMAPEVVEDYALQRAAELTVENGYDWFRIISRDLVGEERGGVSLGAGVGSGSYGRRGGVSVGVGGNFGKVGASEYWTARVEILMGEGDAPDDRDVYHARDVLGQAAPVFEAPADGAE